MCGILAVLSFDNEKLDEKLIIRMRDTMFHRGPDDAGFYVDGPIALGHRRLSIIDLTPSGHQPMTNEDGSIVISYNGEIYNYLELRQNLIAKGHRFSSTSDTEVILHQYEENGEECLQKFNGMFSFVLWDSKEKRLFAARDRLGIKPLYYYADNKKIILASELKAIIEDPFLSRIADYQAIADYFFVGRSLGGKTMFQNIKEIEPGYMMTVDVIRRQIHIKKYWDVVYNYNYSRTDENVKDELFCLIDDSIKVHCRSDASLGSHLSGGLDSSTIVAFAGRHQKPLKTFSIKFSDDDYIDETRYAKAVARHVKADYHESSPAAMDMTRLLPLLIWHMDIPMTTEGAFAYYIVSQLAQKYVKVSLTGHGGDELFAGYPAQFQASYEKTDMFDLCVDPHRVVKNPFPKKLIESLFKKGFWGSYESIKNRLFSRQMTFEDIWIQLHCGSPPQRSPIYQDDFVRELGGYSPRDSYIKPLIEVNTANKLDRCLYHDLRVYLPGLLHFEDRVSMAVSIESRVPLLDYRIVEFLATVPPEQKVNGMQLQPKHLLREITSSLLPDLVRKRKQKFNFSVPGKFWLSKEIKQFTKEILLSPESLKRGILKPQTLKNALNNFNNKTAIWQFVNVELWFKIFIDKDPYWISQIKL